MTPGIPPAGARPPSGQAPDPGAALRRRRFTPPTRWRLLAGCLVVLLALIAFQGFVTHGTGAEGRGHPQAHGTGPLAGSAPLLVASDGKLHSPQPAAGKRIALTFDDGPDPEWTPKILAVLRENGVPGTFFMVGSQAARHPDLVREVERSGGEIGNHTFTHADLLAGPMWRRRAEIEFTETILVGITGHHTRFLRPPYSSGTNSVTVEAQRDLARLIGDRYILALTDYDSKDWERRGVARIVANASPKAGRGGVVMFHDGGGDRAQTVAALRVMIPRLKAQGYQFVPLRGMLGLSAAEAAPPASLLVRLRADAFLLAFRLSTWLTGALAFLILAVGVLVAARLLFLLPLAGLQVRRTRPSGDATYLPTVAVLVPAYNEAVGIEKAVRSLTMSDYPSYEIVVIDDGSTDGTGDIVEALGLPGVRLIRRPNGGKAAALTTGLMETEAEIVVMVDGDTVFEPETIRRLVQPLSDPRVAAVSGNTKVGNRSGLLGRWQHIEYVMGFNLDRRMYEVLQCTPTVPGAIGAFRRSALVEIGGVSGQTLAEDTDVTLAIGRRGHRVVYAEDARAWTEAPSSFSGLWRQRYRWSFGTMQAVWKHRRAVLGRDRGDRRIGWLALPYMVLFQMALPVLAPLIDLYLVYSVLFGDAGPMIAFWLAFTAAQLVLAVVGFRLDRESLRSLWALPLQQLVYRQLMYLVVIESAISALVGARAVWRHIPRTGDVEVPSTPSAASP